MGSNFFIINGKFATKTGGGGFYTINEPTISPDVESEDRLVALTAYDKVIGAMNTVRFYSNVSVVDATKTLKFN